MKKLKTTNDNVVSYKYNSCVFLFFFVKIIIYYHYGDYGWCVFEPHFDLSRDFFRFASGEHLYMAGDLLTCTRFTRSQLDIARHQLIPSYIYIYKFTDINSYGLFNYRQNKYTCKRFICLNNWNHIPRRYGRLLSEGRSLQGMG